jgi:hypothetical protein
MLGFFVEKGVSLTFCLGWPQITILPTSTSQVAEIIGVSHHTWLFLKEFLRKILAQFDKYTIGNNILLDSNKILKKYFESQI